MLKRDYTAPQFNVRDDREVRQQQVAQSDNSSTQVKKFGEDTSWGGALIDQLSKVGNQMMNQADAELNNLYLEGAAQAGQVESEEELEGNALTRDWKVAGYRDTMGKLALADSEAQFTSDIQRLRESGPEELQGYLSKRREKLMPGIAGMSREARVAATGQLFLQDRAAIKTHTSEHTKFIIEQKSQAVQAQWNTTMRNLGAAQARSRLGDLDPKAFNSQLDLAVGTMVGTVWEDRSLPADVQQQLTFEMIQGTLANDSVELYDYIANTEIPDGTGGQSTLMSRLDGKQQQQLANGYRDAYNRTNDERNQFQMEQVAGIEAQIASNVFKGTHDDLTEVLNPLVARGVISGEKRMGILKAFNTERYKSDVNYQLSDLTLKGNTHGLFMLGKTAKDGMDAVDAGLIARGASPEVRLSTYLTIGANGTPGGFEKAGEVLGPALRQMRSPDGTILPQHKATFLAINKAINTAKKGGNPYADVQLLSGLPEGDRTFTTRVLAEVADGKTLELAIATATDTEGREAKLTPSMREASSRGMATAVTEHINNIEPMSMLGYSWNAVKSIIPGDVGRGAQASIGTRVKSDQWFGESPTNKLYVAGIAAATQEAASRILKTSPLTTKPEQVVLAAQADVAARTIQTRHGPIIVPPGANTAALFQVAPANVSRIGPAIDKMLKETKDDARYHVQYTHRGVFVQEYDNKGVPIGNGDYLKPGAVNAVVAEMMNTDQKKSEERYGGGKTVKHGALEVKFNGDNTAAAPQGWMLAFRENLVKNEGIRDTPYKDQTGKKDAKGRTIETLGVGVTSTSPHYPKVMKDGKVAPSEIRRSFMAASNAAAVAGTSAAKAADVHNKHGFTLMSELAYQSGTSFLRQQNKTGTKYREFAQALKGKDVWAAQAAFKNTAAWYWSADRKKPNVVTARQKHYLDLIEKAITGE